MLSSKLNTQGPEVIIGTLLQMANLLKPNNCFMQQIVVPSVSEMSVERAI